MTSIIDIDCLLQAVAPETPCGEDLEYQDVMTLEGLAKEKPEQEIGGTFVPAQQPDWRAVRNSALEVTGKTKDLRVLVILVRALVETDGYLGLRDGLALTRGLLERYWDGIHPVLDPEDNDPTFRINTLTTLCDAQTTLQGIRNAPLVASRALGRFSLRDLAMASGELAAAPDTEPPDRAAIEAAFMDVDLEELKATAEAIESAGSDVAAMETYVAEQVGVANAPSLEALTNLLKESTLALQEPLARRGVQTAAAEDAVVEGAAGGGAPGARPLAGEVTSRDDVIRVLDKACDYYRRHEPSSPVPLLLERAKRLVNKDFMEIINDLAPDGLTQVQAIRGPSDEDSSESY